MVDNLSIEDIPADFKNIGSIVSNANRNALIQSIHFIILNIKDFEIYSPDAKTQRLIKNFLTYLNYCCKDLTRIAIYHSWLCRYADSVVDHLLTLRSKRIRSGEGLFVTKDSDFLDRTTSLIVALYYYQSRCAVDLSKDPTAIKLLQDILILSTQIVPNYDDYRYINLIEMINTLTLDCNHWTKMRYVRGQEKEIYIAYTLHHILIKAYRYLSHIKYGLDSTSDRL